MHPWIATSWMLFLPISDSLGMSRLCFWGESILSLSADNWLTAKLKCFNPKCRSRIKRLDDSLNKLSKYLDVSNPKKQQTNERSGGSNMLKMGTQSITGTSEKKWTKTLQDTAPTAATGAFLVFLTLGMNCYMLYFRCQLWNVVTAGWKYLKLFLSLPLCSLDQPECIIPLMKLLII